MTAGMCRSFTSEKPNFASRAATHVAHRTSPPAAIAALDAPITGSGHSLISAYIFASCAIVMFSWPCSAPCATSVEVRAAQKFGPLPRRTTARHARADAPNNRWPRDQLLVEAL